MELREGGTGSDLFRVHDDSTFEREVTPSRKRRGYCRNTPSVSQYAGSESWSTRQHPDSGPIFDHLPDPQNKWGVTSRGSWKSGWVGAPTVLRSVSGRTLRVVKVFLYFKVL